MASGEAISCEILAVLTSRRSSVCGLRGRQLSDGDLSPESLNAGDCERRGGPEDLKRW